MCVVCSATCVTINSPEKALPLALEQMYLYNASPGPGNNVALDTLPFEAVTLYLGFWLHFS